MKLSFPLKKISSSYRYSSSLLVQFVLHEFTATLKEVSKIKVIYQRLEEKIIRQHFMENTAEHLSKLNHSLSILNGIALASQPSFPWNPQEGPLVKLNQYATDLSLKAQRKEEYNFHLCISSAYHSSIQAKETIESIETVSSDIDRIQKYKFLYEYLDDLIDAIMRSCRILVQILLFYKEDHHVLYYLVKNHQNLDSVFGKSFVLKVFKKMHPRNEKIIIDILKNQFEKQGFYFISEKISNEFCAIHDK